jgi:histidyl-tRNA synthetase
VIIGGDELAAGKVKLRDMGTHDEQLIDRAGAAATIAGLLS